MEQKYEKQLVWIGNSREDIRNFPEDVKDVIGYALYLAQKGGKHSAAKPLKGFKGAGVLEVVDDYKGNAYRAVYTVNYKEVVYVLHAFQKKSKRGIETPKQEIDLIKARLQKAIDHYQSVFLKKRGKNYERC